MRVSCFLIISLVGALCLAGQSAAQSFNIDIDGGAGPGAGPPSNSFSGAASQMGFWCDPLGGTTQPFNLAGLDGVQTGAQMQALGGIGNYGGFNNSGNTGDYALLLNDFADISGSAQYHFSGLTPGQYRIYTYAVEPVGLFEDVQVSVPGSVQGIQHVTGPMPGNQLVLGITHSVHEITISGTSFEVDVTGPFAHTRVNGFQIVAVPEPGELATLGLAFAMLLVGRRRFRPISRPGG
jgi:hypothetical protein